MMTAEETRTARKATGIRWNADDLGPRQAKKFRTAINDLRGLASTWVELSGVVGGEEHRSVLYAPLSAGQGGEEWTDTVIEAERAIHAEYDGTATKANYREIIEKVGTAKSRLYPKLTVIDKRETAEEREERHAEQARKAAEYQAQREAEEKENPRRPHTPVAEDAKALRAEFKAKGWNSKAISVRSSSYSGGSSIRVEIKSPSVPMNVVRPMAAAYERISRCKTTGDILSGGNRFINVEYSRECMDEMAAQWVQPCADAIGKLDPADPNRHATIEGSGCTVSYAHGGPSCGYQLWNDSQAGMHVSDADTAARCVARYVAERDPEPEPETDPEPTDTHCGHSREEIETADEGTSYCRQCERESQPQASSRYTIHEIYHTKRKATIYIAAPNEHLDDAEFRQEKARCILMDGWYSRKWKDSPGGFAFGKRSLCEQFAGMGGDDGGPDGSGGGDGDSPAPKPKDYTNKIAATGSTLPTPDGNALAEKFRGFADGLQPQIDQALAPLSQNWTPKRGLQHARRVHSGHDMERMQAALRALARAHDEKTVPLALLEIRTKKQVARMTTTHADTSSGHYGYRETGEPVDTGPLAVALRELVERFKTDDDRAAEEARAHEADRLAKLERVRQLNIPGFFPTPAPVAALVVERAQIEDNHTVLEPSAGIGSLADACPNPENVTCVERDATLCELLRHDYGDRVTWCDFLNFGARPDGTGLFDRIVMNPPFEKQADIDHVRYAYRNHLAPGGRLVSIMAAGVKSRTGRKATEFRQWAESLGADIEDLPPGSFDTVEAFRRTGVSCVLVTIDKPE